MKSYIKVILSMLIWGTLPIFVAGIPCSSPEIVMWRIIFGMIFLAAVFALTKNKSGKEMYKKLAEKEGWKIEIMEEDPSEAGGYTLISFMIKGENVYSKLKYESGAHRVQRVPVTETQGRVHTSTATVLVMPEAEEVDAELDMNEVRIDITRSSGCGGQGVNTTDSAVRVTHIPTGTVVTCQNERSQIQNKEQAMKVLKNKLLMLKLEAQEAEMNKIKGNQMNIEFGSQIRSYVMHPYSMVKDHRTNEETSNVTKVMDGDIDIFIESNLKRGL